MTGSATFNGAPVRVIRTNSGDENYFSNDPVTGIRFHGGFFVDPAGDETDTYSPPLLLAAPDMALGVPAITLANDGGPWVPWIFGSGVPSAGGTHRERAARLATWLASRTPLPTGRVPLDAFFGGGFAHAG